MFRFLKGATGERAFNGAVIGVLFIVLLFFISIVVSLISYADWGTFVQALLSEEILFAIRLSVITATITTVISMLIAVPTAYAISRK